MRCVPAGSRAARGRGGHPGAGRVLPAARRRTCDCRCRPCRRVTGSPPRGRRRAGGAERREGGGRGSAGAAARWSPRPRAASSSVTWLRWWNASSASCPPKRCCAPPGKPRGRRGRAPPWGCLRYPGGSGAGAGRCWGSPADAACPWCVAACAGCGGSAPGASCGRGSASPGCRRWSRAPPGDTRWSTRWPASWRWVRAGASRRGREGQPGARRGGGIGALAPQVGLAPAQRAGKRFYLRGRPGVSSPAQPFLPSSCSRCTSCPRPCSISLTRRHSAGTRSGTSRRKVTLK